MLMRSTKSTYLNASAIKIAMHRGMKKAIVALARRLAVIMHRMCFNDTASTEIYALSVHGALRIIKCDRRKSSSTQRWNDVPRGTMDEVSSYVRLNLQSH